MLSSLPPAPSSSSSSSSSSSLPTTSLPLPSSSSSGPPSSASSGLRSYLPSFLVRKRASSPPPVRRHEPFVEPLNDDAVPSLSSLQQPQPLPGSMKLKGEQFASSSFTVIQLNQDDLHKRSHLKDKNQNQNYLLRHQHNQHNQHNHHHPAPEGVPRSAGSIDLDDRAAPAMSSASSASFVPAHSSGSGSSCMNGSNDGSIHITIPQHHHHHQPVKKSWNKPRLILAVGASLIGISLLMLLSKNLVVTLLGLVEQSGFMGPVVLSLLFVLVSFPFFYGYSVFAIAGGFLFPFQVALAAVLLGSTCGSVLNLWFAQRFFGQMIQKKLGKYRFYRAIIRAIEKDAFRIIVLCRLIPVPFGIMNSILAMAKVALPTYINGTLFGLLPEVIILVYFGTTLRSLQDVLNGHGSLEGGQIVLMVLGVIVALVLFVFLMRLGKEAMNEMDAEQVRPVTPVPELLVQEENPRISEEDIDELPSRLPLDLSDHEGEEGTHRETV